jgi:predicted PurR-regulated permease PerM
MDSLKTPEPIQTRSPMRAIPTREIVHLTLQLLALGFLLIFCYNIISPFINPILWAGIFAIALYPLHQKLKKILKGKAALASTILTLIVLAIFILPSVMFTFRTASEARQVFADYRSGKIHIKPPGENVKEWPVIGTQVYNAWTKASTDINAYIADNPEQVRAISSKGVELIKSTGGGLLLLTIAIILSGVLLCYSTQVGDFTRRFTNHLLGNTKVDMAAMAAVTVRNVVKGILGVAVIQSFLAGAGMVVGGVPYAGIWTLLCLILAIVQIGTLPVAIGVIIYIWSNGTTTTAIILTVWMLLVGLLDNVLKPLVMGKGAPVPMLVIFLGAVGGFIFLGFIGMFTGAVILSLGYKLFDIWLKGMEP